jgi:hypothetical protein
MSYEPPLKVTIPTPSQLPKGFGVNSTGKRGGNLRIRCTNNEYDVIQKEAAKLDITLAMFCRWCAIHVSKQLIKHRKELSTDMEAGDDDGCEGD